MAHTTVRIGWQHSIALPTVGRIGTICPYPSNTHYLKRSSILIFGTLDFLECLLKPVTALSTFASLYFLDCFGIMAKVNSAADFCWPLLLHFLDFCKGH